MSPELIAIVAVGVALTGVILTSQRALRAEIRDLRQSTEARFAALENQIADLRDQITDLRERMAKLEGLLDGLREAIVLRASQNVTQ